MNDLIEKKPFNLLNVRALELDRSIPTRVELFWTNFFFFTVKTFSNLSPFPSLFLDSFSGNASEYSLILKVDFHEFRFLLENKREIFA